MNTVRCGALAVVMLLTLAVLAGAQSAEVYRIVILDNQTFSEARKGKQLLESWDYQPIVLDQAGANFRVLYGNFPTREVAEQALAQLKAEGINAGEIVATGVQPQAETPQAPAGTTEGINYSVFLREFADESQAQTLRQQLQQAGFAPVVVRPSGRFFHVYVGNESMQQATATLGRLSQQGYSIDGVTKVVVAPADVAPPPRKLPISPTAPSGTAVPGDVQAALSEAITQTDVWRQLTPEQQRQVKNMVLMQQELRSGDPLAEKVIDINKRLENLDERLKGVISLIEEDKRKRTETLQTINELFTQAENFIRSSEDQQAVLKLREILELDPDNSFGQKQLATRRLQMIEARLKGEAYEGQGAENERKFQALREEANQLTALPNASLAQLNRALSNWNLINSLDPNRYGQQAKEQIASLEGRIDQLTQSQNSEAMQAQRRGQYLTYGLIAGVAVLGLLLILINGMRSRKRHNELMRKVQEITSIRPMRELTGSTNAGLLDSRAGNMNSEPDIFSPRTPGSSEQPGDPLASLDPLGGLESDAPKKGKKGKPAAPVAPAAATAAAEDDNLFGAFGSGAPEAQSGGDAFGFDDIFGGGGASEEKTSRIEATPTVNSPGEESFSDLFGAEPPRAPVATKPGQRSSNIVAVQEEKSEIGPISFDDLVAVSNDHGRDHSSDNGGHSGGGGGDATDLLSMFDNVAGGSIGEASGGGNSPFDDSPFASLMNDLPSVGEPGAGSQFEDDTEIPSIKLDAGEPSLPSAATSMAFDLGGNSPENDQTNTAFELPAFSLDDMSAVDAVFGQTQVAGGAAATAGATMGFHGVELDFENDSVGEPPMGWEGDYAFSSLLVKADTPPKGAMQYIAFEKREGAGKAYYGYRFPDVGGVVGIEFDLRCNDKNKFLLGFYVEKDGDFQQAVHTKILRSEAQTTPTIHMQGESAPYLLGSWAHIKYVVDLNEGKLNGFIDSTQVVRDVALTPNPGTLNTLSIRDNINTTGVLLLDNIKVYQIS